MLVCSLGALKGYTPFACRGEAGSGGIVWWVAIDDGTTKGTVVNVATFV